MFKVPSLILTAALFGYAEGAACYALYGGSGQYSENDWVSANVQETETCSSGDAGCVNGSKTVTKRYNYECISNAWCPNSGYYPGGIYSSSAWSQDSAECDTTVAVATVAPPTAWSFGGCPSAYSSGGDYSAGDAVSVDKSTYTQVFTCNAYPNDGFCSQGGYEPGTSLYWETAWTLEGSCTGSLTPTGSPVFNSIADAGGCPEAFASGANYEEGDKVAKEGLVFQCKGWPNSAHCSQAGYEPLVVSGHVEAWKDAWAIVGYCSGTIAPTSSPSFVALEDMGACPAEWQTSTYEEGDKVASSGLVFTCGGWPNTPRCGQAGYQPLTTSGHTEAWKDAWTLQGYCSGSMGPTASPSFDTVDHIGRCPEAWSAGDNIKYEEGDMVSIVVSQEPMRSVAFTCKGWPYSGHCGQYSPDNELGGKLGWTLAGTCGKSDGGTYAPTTSPSWDPASIVSACPEEWGANSLDYEAGDKVSAINTISSEPKLIFECLPWPASGYCNQAGFKPLESIHWKMAWKLLGACAGSFSPTISPAAFVGTCTYDKCRMVDTEVGCTPGSWGCGCATGTTLPNSSCTKTTQVNQCDPTDVNPWSQQNYETGDVVRLGITKFTCRTWPNYLWCRQAAYKPTLESGIWSDAWTKSGECPIP